MKDRIIGWIEAALGLKPGSYAERGAGESLTFVDPHYGENKRLSVYELVAPDGRVHKVVAGEVSNNIWAIGYWAGDSNG